jgi:hypothetical protein
MDVCDWYLLATFLSWPYCMVSSHISRTKHLKGMECSIPRELYGVPMEVPNQNNNIYELCIVMYGGHS